MNSKWHLSISIIKSALRIVGCIIYLVTRDQFGIILLASLLLVAELLGILEELGDKR